MIERGYQAVWKNRDSQYMIILITISRELAVAAFTQY